MSDEIKNAIRALEQQAKAIETALTALRSLTDDGVSLLQRPPAAKPNEKKSASSRRGRLSEEGRARLAAAMKARWAAKKKAGQGKKARLRRIR
jgi:Arc/MetJ-type ribon-helix-helix transcriptional regulator